MEYNKEYEAIKLGELVAKEMQGLLSDEEALELKELLGRSPKYREAYEALQQQKAEQLLKKINRYDTASALTRVLQSDKPVVIRKIKSKPFWYAAASIILLFSIATVTYFTLRESKPALTLTSKFGEDILPGGNRAYITLSDGRRIELDSTQTTVKNTDGTLVYEDGRALVSDAKVAYATINTPIGGAYTIILPDGTKAWLNASSSLKYPQQFTSKERLIEIEGEVYLEVSPDKDKPFIVQSKGQRIEVLGTAFNVRNYAQHTVTTLVHGKIALTNTRTQQRIILTLDQQTILSSEGTDVHSVNALEYVGWKEGFITNKDADIHEICSELERWYGVRFIFPAEFKNKERAVISLDRNALLSTLLTSLETTYGVQFTINGKEVQVR